MPESVQPTDSILTSIKTLLGLSEDYTPFDQTVIMDINAVIGILYQLGIGPSDDFAITDSSTTWGEYISESPPNIADVRTYIFLRVRQMFDPPASSAISEAINKLISEVEWRLNVSVDYRGDEE